MVLRMFYMIIGFLCILVTAVFGVCAIYYLASSIFNDELEHEVDKTDEQIATDATPSKHFDKRCYYAFCIKDRYVIDGDRIYHYLRKIDEYLTSYDLEQFDRFYTVYCKELYNTLKKISKCKCTSLYYDLVMETRKTYGSIFSKMLSDIETTIKNDTTSDTDIEGIKNFAKINGDFDENYKAETVDNSASDTSAILTSTISAVENSTKNYANALTHAYEKVRQYKEENEQLTKELEKCRAEAKKHIDTTNSADKLKTDLARIDEVISCQERAGRNDSTLELMRTVRRQIAETGILHGKDNYTDYKLYCWGIPIEDYLNVWKAELDYTHDYFYYE